MNSWSWNLIWIHSMNSYMYSWLWRQINCQNSYLWDYEFIYEFMLLNHLNSWVWNQEFIMYSWISEYCHRFKCCKEYREIAAEFLWMNSYMKSWLNLLDLNLSWFSFKIASVRENVLLVQSNHHPFFALFAVSSLPALRHLCCCCSVAILVDKSGAEKVPVGPISCQYRCSCLPTRSGSGGGPKLKSDAKSIPKRGEASLLGVLAWAQALPVAPKLLNRLAWSALQ